MTISTAVKTRVVNGFTRVAVQVNHPTVVCHKPGHPPVALRTATEVEAICIRQNDLIVAEIFIGPDVSPRFVTSVTLAAANRGDRIRVEWRDNRGRREETETRVS